MKKAFQEILKLAGPYLNTRKNDIHVEISLEFAHKLVEREGGDEDIVLPAIILHDVGWKKVPEHLQFKAFGPRASAPELNRTHEKEGVRIAEKILAAVGYDEKKTPEILEIIAGHDSRREFLSLNDAIVKDADKLWRFTRTGFRIDTERFNETKEQGLKRLTPQLENALFTDSAKNLAAEELEDRIKETEGNE